MKVSISDNTHDEKLTTGQVTQEETHGSEPLVQPNQPAQTEETTAKGTQEEGHVGESPIQPELPAYTGEVTAKGTARRRSCRRIPNPT